MPHLEGFKTVAARAVEGTSAGLFMDGALLFARVTSPAPVEALSPFNAGLTTALLPALGLALGTAFGAGQARYTKYGEVENKAKSFSLSLSGGVIASEIVAGGLTLAEMAFTKNVSDPINFFITTSALFDIFGLTGGAMYFAGRNRTFSKIFGRI